MPFDAAGFPERQEPSGKPRPTDGAICVIIVVISAVLLLMPVSLASLADLVRYLRG